MDGHRFDELSRSLAFGTSRRAVLRGVVGGVAAALAEVTRSRAKQCSSAGRPCAVDQPCCGSLGCSAGVCTPPGQHGGDGGVAGCPAGQARCGDACVDAQTDPANCGGCGIACDVTAGQVCAGGACRCPAGSELCGGRCVPSCPPGQVVDPATCGCACESGGPICIAGDDICCASDEGCDELGCCIGLHQVCGDRRRCAGLSCEGRGTDPHLTCRGRPGFACAADADCSIISSGPCCDGVCVPAIDTSNCGACGHTCDLTNPDERCVHGECCLDFGAACDPSGGAPCCGHNARNPYRCGNDAGEPVCCGTPGALCDPASPGQCCSRVCEDSGSLFTCA